MKRLITIVTICFLSYYSYAQDYNKSSFGAGYGQAYGGLLGVNYSIAPVDRLSFTGAFGFLPIKPFFTMGVGVNLYPLKKSKDRVYTPNIKAQYGYNAAIMILDDLQSEYNRVYYGGRFALGNEFRFGKNKTHGFDIDIFYNVHTEEYENDLEIVKEDSNIDLTESGNISISIGYHFDF